MSQKRGLLCLAGLVTVLMLLTWTLTIAAETERQAQPTAAWTRTLEPVVFTGNQLPLFDGAANNDLFAYAFAAGTWQQIPFQIDEVDATGAYTTENGLLDANDEMVFMAMDLGEQATPSEWIADADSRTYARYEVKVTNPLNPAEQGWAYVCRSATLLPASADYVSWDAGANRIMAGTYVAGFAPAIHPGVDSLELNGSGVDALDRTKIRIRATCHLPSPFPSIPWTFTEETLPSQPGVTPDIDGPVRVGGGTTASGSWSYYSIYQVRAVVDVASFQAPDPCTSIDINWIRMSNDWLDPASTGMAPAIYYDDNTLAGVMIDGNPDSVASAPTNTWKQISGAQGSAVQVADVTLAGGSIGNYYLDDQTMDAGDTGDQQSFGDAGFRVDSPSGQVAVGLTTYVLAPSQPNVGAIYHSYQNNPLEISTAGQSYEPPCAPTGVEFGWTPRPVYVGAETTFGASVSEGQPPFTYTWAFGDDGSLGSGSPATHTFALSGTFAVSLTVSNACSTALPVVHPVLVFEPGGGYLVYLPLVTRNRP
jgi:hypothetical protein